MKVRFKSNPQVEHYSNGFNIHGIGEVIVASEHIGADSVYVHDLEVFLQSKGEWKDMAQAFRDKDIIPDNYHTWFEEPKTREDRERGYFQ